MFRKTNSSSRRAGWAGALLLTALPAGATEPAAGDEPTRLMLRDDLAVRRIAPDVWAHISFKPDMRGRPIDANGLLVRTGEGSVLIDTGWTVEQTGRLLDWSENVLRQPVRYLIVTHAHEDRMGGIAAVLDRQVVILGHLNTSRLSKLYGGPAFHRTFEIAERLILGGQPLELLYPGPGHAPDNMVVYLPKQQILFAGCLVKPATTQSIPDEDANLTAWPLALRRVIERYREVRILVPGHGPPGGVELLSHTMELLEQAVAHRVPVPAAITPQPVSARPAPRAKSR